MSSTLHKRVYGARQRVELRVVLAGGTPTQRDTIKDAIAQVSEVDTEITDLGGQLTTYRGDPEVAFLLLDPADQSSWTAALKLVASNGSRPPVIALLAKRSSLLIQAALRAGFDDVLPLPPSHEDILCTLLRVSEARRKARGFDENKICSLVSVCGGQGISSLAVWLGFALERILVKRTVLVDLDLQAGSLSVLLDVEPEHTVVELADPTSPIDSIRLESVLTKSDEGPALLAAPKRIEEAELVSTAAVEASLKVLHDLFDVVLIDCGSYLNESSVVAFEHSDYVLYIIDQSVTAVRAAQRFLSLFEGLGLRNPPQLIVNRYRPKDNITLRSIEEALNLPICATVPYDEQSFRQMQAMGREFWEHSSASNLHRACGNLARKLFAPESDRTVAAKPNLLSRLLGVARRVERVYGTDRQAQGSQI